MKSRVEDAGRMFESGYGCCQAVLSTYADLFGMDKETALRLASPMGGGIGRMREVCGAVSAMALLAGLKQGNTDPKDEKARTEIYELVRQMSDKFREETGAIVCRELLGLKEREESAAPDVRDRAYYEKRPCTAYVETAAKIVEEILLIDNFM